MCLWIHVTERQCGGVNELYLNTTAKGINFLINHFLATCRIVLSVNDKRRDLCLLLRDYLEFDPSAQFTLLKVLKLSCPNATESINPSFTVATLARDSMVPALLVPVKALSVGHIRERRVRGF